ncbi:MAG: hypothetical protein HC844_06920 [Tabrizicola sp.]|nr:hypothetical protein [Tabrizicola sp.]
MVDPLDFLTALTDFRAKGYALIGQEVEANLQSLAGPLLGARGLVEGAFNIGLAGNGSVQQLVDRFLAKQLLLLGDLRRMLA